MPAKLMAEQQKGNSNNAATTSAHSHAIDLFGRRHILRLKNAYCTTEKRKQKNFRAIKINCKLVYNHVEHRQQSAAQRETATNHNEQYIYLSLPFDGENRIGAYVPSDSAVGE